jgi:hypothetical protein
LFLPYFRQMDDYLYVTLGADGWLRCNGLHRLEFPTLLSDVLHRFGYTELPAYHAHPYHQFGLGRCKVHVDILAHPTDPTMTAWFTTTRGDDLNDTLERAAHQALRSSVSATCRSLATPSLPCSPFKMRATWCGVSAWPPSVTPSFRPTTPVGRSRHTTPST